MGPLKPIAVDTGTSISYLSAPPGAEGRPVLSIWPIRIIGQNNLALTKKIIENPCFNV